MRTYTLKGGNVGHLRFFFAVLLELALDWRGAVGATIRLGKKVPRHNFVTAT
jgi:hypothetical protein